MDEILYHWNALKDIDLFNYTFVRHHETVALTSTPLKQAFSHHGKGVNEDKSQLRNYCVRVCCVLSVARHYPT